MGPGKLQPNHLAGTGRGGSLVEDLFGRKEPVHVSPGLRLLKRGWSIGQSCAIDQFFTAAAAGQFPGVAFIETGLHEFIDSFQKKLNLVGEAVQATFFAPRPLASASSRQGVAQ